MSGSNSLSEIWDDFKKNKPPFMVGMVIVIIFLLSVGVLYLFTIFIGGIIMSLPLNPFITTGIIFGIIILYFIILQIGISSKKH